MKLLSLAREPAAPPGPLLLKLWPGLGLGLLRLPIGLGLAGALLGLVEPRCVCSRGLGANHEGRLSMVTWWYVCKLVS